MEKPVNIGIIGLGVQGKIHLQNCVHLQTVKLLGVADTSSKALQYAKRLGVKNVYENYHDLLRDPLIDAVIVTLPNSLHSECSVKAAEAGKHVLLEKPLARNIEEGKQILLAAKKNGIKLMMGYNMRFDPALKKLHGDIRDGLFGEVEIVGANYVGPGPFRSRSGAEGPVSVPSWWFDKKASGGGVLLDLGSHLINLLNWYFGEVEYAYSYLGHIFNMDLEDTATCFMKYKDGPVALINVGWFSRDFTRTLQIFGTARNTQIHIAKNTLASTILGDIKAKIGIHQSNVSYEELKHFATCLQNDTPLLPSGEEGLADLRVIQMAYTNVLESYPSTLPESV